MWWWQLEVLYCHGIENVLKDSRKKLLPSLPDKSHRPTSSFVFPNIVSYLRIIVLFMVIVELVEVALKVPLKSNLRASVLKFSWRHVPDKLALCWLCFVQYIIGLNLWFNLTTQIVVATALVNYRRSMIFLCCGNLTMLYVLLIWNHLPCVAPQYTAGSSSSEILYNWTDVIYPQNLPGDSITLPNFLQKLCNQNSANFRREILCYFAAFLGQQELPHTSFRTFLSGITDFMVSASRI